MTGPDRVDEPSDDGASAPGSPDLVKLFRFWVALKISRRPFPRRLIEAVAGRYNLPPETPPAPTENRPATD